MKTIRFTLTEGNKIIEPCPYGAEMFMESNETTESVYVGSEMCRHCKRFVSYNVNAQEITCTGDEVVNNG